MLPALREEASIFSTLGVEPPVRLVEERFDNDVKPLLTPIDLTRRVVPARLQQSLNFIVSLSGVDAFGRVASIAIVQAPRSLHVFSGAAGGVGIPHGFVMLTSVISAFINELFLGLEVKGCYRWRVTRNSDLFVDEEEITNLRQALQGELSQRNFGAAVRLEIDKSMPEDLEQFLQHEFLLQPRDTYRIEGPVNLSRLSRVCDVVGRRDLLFPEFRPGVPPPFNEVDADPSALFAAIRKSDVLLHHPYQSFRPVLEFLTAAARDPAVVAIKQTIYRTGEDSELMRLLVAAAKAGKEVTVVVELMARFDEQTNINLGSTA